MSVKEKAAAPVSSVGADGKQPLINNNKGIIADLPTQGNLQATNNRGSGAEVTAEKRDRIDGLETVSMTELYDTAYPPKIPIVDGLIYAGTYLFVGAPKVGKSFFMAQLGYHVSMGLDLWDYPVRKGTVLYLALEDDYARLQKRLSRMFGMESSENFYFATQSKTLNEGLDEQFNQFVKEHTDARLIIIDTLQKVREAGGDKFSYASDYEIVTKLKGFSDEHAELAGYYQQVQDALEETGTGASAEGIEEITVGEVTQGERRSIREALATKGRAKGTPRAEDRKREEQLQVPEQQVKRNSRRAR